MCRIYKNGKPDAWVRACYLTKQPGLRVPIDQAVWNNRDHLVLGKDAQTKTGRPTR